MTPEISRIAPTLPKAPTFKPMEQANARIGAIAPIIHSVIAPAASFITPAAVIGLTLVGFKTMLGFPPKFIRKIVGQ